MLAVILDPYLWLCFQHKGGVGVGWALGSEDPFCDYVIYV